MTRDVDASHAFEGQARGLVRGLRSRQAGGVLTAFEVTELIREQTIVRLGFVALMAIIATAVLPWPWLIGWVAVLAAWELAVRPFLEARVVLPIAARSESAGTTAMAAVHFTGACAYAVFAAAAWSTGTPIGTVLATAWICGSANNAFVYFSSHRLLLSAVIAPHLVCAIVMPLATAGFTPLSAAASVVLITMVVAAGLFGRDRERLLSQLAGHATARAAAEQANIAKSQFLATISHELRNPLNTIIGYAELIEEEGQTETTADAAKIKGSARELLSVVNLILDVSRVEAGIVELRRERFRAAEVLEQVREASGPIAAANHIRIVVPEPADLGEIEGDYTRLYQCVMQLLITAAQTASGADLAVSLCCEAHDGAPAIVYAITEQPLGLDAEVPAALAKARDDSRLGLSFVRRIAQLMGGDVVLRTGAGGAAAYRLWIPTKPKSLGLNPA